MAAKKQSGNLRDFEAKIYLYQASFLLGTFDRFSK